MDNKHYIDNKSNSNSVVGNHLDNFLLAQHPEYETGKDDYIALHKNQDDISSKAIIGFSIFTFIFVICVPILLKNLKNEDIILAYMANLDLIATSISFKNGPFNLDLFRYLYIDNRPIVGYINQNLINYIVLITISYIIIKTSVKNKNIGDGMGKVSIILIMTYLFPGRIISESMHFIYDKLIEHLNLEGSVSWTITFIIGLLLALIFIIIEAFAIKLFYKSISKFYESKVFKHINFD